MGDRFREKNGISGEDIGKYSGLAEAQRMRFCFYFFFFFHFTVFSFQCRQNSALLSKNSFFFFPLEMSLSPEGLT